MKQKLHQSLIATLVTMLLLLAGSSVSAQEKYGLLIGDVEVTSANCSDLTAIPGVKGKVTYDPTTKTLTLEDASINVGKKRLGICSKVELTCVVKGEVSITSNKSAMVFYSNAIIKGNGQLTLKSSERCGISIHTGAALLIEGCTVYTEGGWGIAGINGTSGESLTIRNATVTAKGSTYGSICDLANFTLEGCKITKPAGAVWNASKHAVCDASGNVKGEVVITPPVKEYGLEIVGVKVTSANCSDLSVIDGVKGKVSYDPTTKTLTLEDASIDDGEVQRHSIWSTAELTCVVKGKVSITSNGWGPMAFEKNAIIKGNGQLTLKSSSGGFGIYTEAALLIEGCTVYTEGNFGIASETGSSRASLTIRNASVTAKGTEGSILDLTNFTLEGCEITKPAGAVWNASEHAVCDASGNIITDEVVIKPVEEYGLKIAGVEVTSANCSDLSAIPGVSGTVSYDPTTKTLTLEDASIDGGQSQGIGSTDELTCVVKGEVSITSNNSSAMEFLRDAIIKGNGQLTLKSSKVCGIYTVADLLIEGCTVYAEGKWGITGEDGSWGESLKIRNASVTAKGTEASIRDFTNFILEGCEITKPAGATWNYSERAVCDASGNVITDEVVITPPVEEYGLKIAGVAVTSANCKDLSAIPGVKGKVSYDPTTKTLYLEDASIDVEGKRLGIWSTDALTCVVKGEVSITSNNNWSAMEFDKNAIIKGNGQLTLKSSKDCGIYTRAALLIEGCTVYAEGAWGIAGSDVSSGESLTIRNATVTAKGTKGSIRYLTNFTLEGCEITKPARAAWFASKEAVCDDLGTVITDEVVISPKGGVTPAVKEYGLKIAGVDINEKNYKEISKIPGVKGKVSYDPSTKTLTLEDASIDVGEERQGIYSTDELTCVVKGKVSITNNNNSDAIVFFNNAIIKGNGQLTLKSSKGNGIYTEATLLIEGCTIYAEGVFGIAGFDGSCGESLTIRNASVTAKGTEGSILNLANFTLEGCEIMKPAGAVWNASKHAVCDASGNVITSEVVISPKGGTAIDFVTPEQLPAEGAIYDMNGVLRSEPLEELPTGVYIVGGQKVMHVQR